MRLHHHVKHGVLKIASLFKGKIRISLLLLSILVISYFAASYVFNRGFSESRSPQQTLGAATLAALDLHLLASDEFAIVSKSVGKPTGKKVNHTLQLNSGDSYTFTADENMVFSLIEGSDKAVTYIKLSDDTEIHKKNENISNSISEKQKGKVESSVSDKLQTSGATANVIIQFNVPFDKYYDRTDTKEKRNVKNNQFEQTKKSISAKLNGKSKFNKDLKLINGISATIDAKTLSFLENDPNVKKVDLDKEVRISLDTSLDQIKARDAGSNVDANGNAITGLGKKIAVIDTGVDYTHPDLGGCLEATCKVIGGYDFVNNDADPMDDNGHGTHVAATAAGKGLLNGVAPGASIVAYKVCSASGSCYGSNIISAIDYSVDPNRDGDTSDHLDVGTMSLGGGGNPDDSMSLAVDRATAAGVTYTIAAGNSGSGASTIQSPGTARTAITVAASCKTSQIGTTCSGPIASFSSRGPLVWNGVDLQKPDVAAPGVLICAARWASAFGTSPTCFDSQHVRISGTSMATPHVAGAVALILQAHPEFTPAQVKQLLKSTTHTLGLAYNDQGAGEIDIKAALPWSNNVTASPATWTITSDPTKQQSVHAQQFSVTPIDPNVVTLNAEVVTNLPGVTGVVSKSILQVANRGTDSFNVTLTVDNDVVKAGTFVGQIVFKENGIIKGNIPLFLTIKPTLLITPATVDYGIDDPSIANWVSNTKTLTVKNLRTDAPASVQISSGVFPTGVTLQAPSSISVPANGSMNVDTKIAVDNTKVSNDIYNGNIAFTAGGNSSIVAGKFTKFYVLTVQDINATNLSKAGWVIVHNRNGKIIYDTTTNSPRTFYLDAPGTYDVAVWYINVVVPNQSSYQLDHFVVKEGINVSGGNAAVVNTSIDDAQNLVRIVPTDSTGATPQLYEKQQKIVYLPQSNPWMSYIFGSGGQQQQINDVYFSNVSSNYRYSRLAAPVQPKSLMHYFYIDFTGLTASKTVTNTPSDFKMAKVQWNVDQQGGSIQPLIMAGLGGAVACVYQNAQFLSQPVTQTVYSLIPFDSGQMIGSMSRTAPVYSYTYDGEVTPYFGTDTLLRKTFSLANPLPDRTATIYAGLGPTIWFGKFQNTPTHVAIRTYFDNRQLETNYTPFLRQDYSSRPVPSVPFTISKGATTVYSGSTPIFPFGYLKGDVYVGTAGVYEFKATVPYKAKGLDMTGKVSAVFDTSRADPNPPSIKRLYYYTNDERSEIYDPNGLNKVEVDFDPVGGTLTNATIAFSTDGQTFEQLPVTNNGLTYTAILPQTGTGKVTIKVTAKDTAANELNYSFELPQGVSSAPLPSITPTGIPTAAPTPTSTPTPTPTPTLTPTPTPTPVPDTISPKITLTSPKGGTTVAQGSTVTITDTATDNVGVAKVELYIDSKLQQTVTTSPFTFIWNTTNTSTGIHTLNLKAYDFAGNIGVSSTIKITVKDKTGPKITLTNPTNGSIVAVNSNVTFTADASDQSGIAKVVILTNNTARCSDTTAPYSCVWKIPAKTGVVYTVQARAFDKANNQTTTTAITITSR